jgi:hypothetical protein
MACSIFLKIREDISSSRCTTGVLGKWKKIKVLIIFFTP